MHHTRIGGALFFICQTPVLTAAQALLIGSTVSVTGTTAASNTVAIGMISARSATLTSAAWNPSGLLHAITGYNTYYVYSNPLNAGANTMSGALAAASDWCGVWAAYKAITRSQQQQHPPHQRQRAYRQRQARSLLPRCRQRARCRRHRYDNLDNEEKI